MRKALSLMVSGYTCVARQLASWLQQDVGIRKPVTQIYNGVDTATFRPAGPGEKLAVRQAMGLLPVIASDVLCGV